MSVPSRIPTDCLVGEIEKNQRETVRVQLREYQQHELVDIRVFAASGDKGTVPTGKGVSLSVQKLGDLISLLQQARTEAEMRGILEPGEAA